MKTLILITVSAIMLSISGHAQCLESIPYIANFESYAPPLLPPCVESYEETFISNDWRTAPMPIGDTPNNVVQFPTYNPDVEFMSATMLFPYLPTQAGIQYKLSFNYGNSDPNAVINSLSVYLSSWSKMITNIAYIENISGAAHTFESGPITLNQTGVNSLEINISTYRDRGNFYIDNIVFEEWGCTAPNGLNVSAVTETGATLTWTSNNAPNYEYVIVPAGQQPEFGIAHTTTTVAVNDLQPGTAYTAYIRGFCFDSWSTWSPGINFTTAGTMSIVQHEKNDVVLYPNPAKDAVTVFAPEPISKVEIYNTIGQLLHQETVAKPEVVIGLQNMAAGAYILMVYSDIRISKIKLIKE